MSKLFKRLSETELPGLSTFLGSNAESYSTDQVYTERDTRKKYYVSEEGEFDE